MILRFLSERGNDPSWGGMWWYCGAALVTLWPWLRRPRALAALGLPGGSARGLLADLSAHAITPRVAPRDRPASPALSHRPDRLPRGELAHSGGGSRRRLKGLGRCSARWPEPRAPRSCYPDDPKRPRVPEVFLGTLFMRSSSPVKSAMAPNSDLRRRRRRMGVVQEKRISRRERNEFRSTTARPATGSRSREAHFEVAFAPKTPFRADSLKKHGENR